MFVFLALVSLFPGHLIAGQDCAVVGDVKYSSRNKFEFSQMEEDPPRSYVTTSRDIIATEECLHFSADVGYLGRICNLCYDDEQKREAIGGFIAQGAAVTEFGRQIDVARADLLDIGFIDDEGNRVDEKSLDWTLFPQLECFCEDDLVSEETGACPSSLVCGTSAETEYGSVGVAFGSSIVGNIASLRVNVSIVHETLEGTPFILVGVSERFKKSVEENGSYKVIQGPARVVFDAACGQNPVTLESISPEETTRDTYLVNHDLTPPHNRVVFNMDATNATCDWSYTIEIELEETSAGVHHVESASLVALLAAALLM